MTNGLPRVTGAEVLRAPLRAGFQEVRRNGSHVHLARPGSGRLVTVPLHRGETLKLGTISTILKQAEMTADELRQWL